MKQSLTLVSLACCLTLGSAGIARAGAPQPDQRQGDFEHVCRGGQSKALACTIATQDRDCPRSNELRAAVAIDARTHRTAGDSAARFERHERVRIRGRAKPVDVYALPSAAA